MSRSMRGSLLSLLAIVALIGVYKSTAHTAPSPTITVAAGGEDQDSIGDARDAAARVALAALQKCAGKPATLRCSVARGRVIAEIVADFETAMQMYDPRVLDEAYVALGAASGPLQIAAVGYLDRIAVHDDKLQRKALAALVDAIAGTRSLAVGAQIARSLAGSPLRQVADRWTEHHKGFPSDDQVTDYYLPIPMPDLAALGFTLYDNAIPYAVADTDRSIGYATHDSFDKVVAFFAKQTGSAPTKPEQWQQFAMAAAQAETTPASARANQPSAADVAEMQRLSAEYQRTKDPALMQQLQQVMSRKKPLAPIGSRVPNAMVTGVYLPHMNDKPTAFVVKKLPNHIALMVFVYPEPSLDATVIEYGWSLVDADPLVRS